MNKINDEEEDEGDNNETTEGRGGGGGNVDLEMGINHVPTKGENASVSKFVSRSLDKGHQYSPATLFFGTVTVLAMQQTFVDINSSLSIHASAWPIIGDVLWCLLWGAALYMSMIHDNNNNNNNNNNSASKETYNNKYPLSNTKNDKDASSVQFIIKKSSIDQTNDIEKVKDSPHPVDIKNENTSISSLYQIDDPAPSNNDTSPLLGNPSKRLQKERRKRNRSKNPTDKMGTGGGMTSFVTNVQ
jgi:hypothetical protein